MGAPKRADWREGRHKRVWALKQEGWPQKDIATALGVSAGAVSHCLSEHVSMAGSKRSRGGHHLGRHPD